MTVDPLVALVARLGLACVLGSAAAHKLSDRASFRAAVGSYAILPERLVAPAAAMLPAVELAAAALLIGGLPSGAIAALGLLLLYSGAIAANLVRGRREIDCGCFGPGRSGRLSGWLVVRNAALAAASLVAAAPPGSRSLGGLDLATGTLALVALGLVWAAAERLLASWPAMRALAEGA